MCKIMKNVILILVLAWLFLPGYSNNVRLNGTVKVTDVTSGVATLELDLAWDNSWRDNFNWDAVWIFLKYKPASGAWSHVMLQETGNEVTPGYQVMNGKNTDGSVVGVYVFLDKNGVKQQASTKVKLKWACPNNYAKADFDNNRIFLLAQGIEMVYVPFGAYYLGDGVSDKTFGDAEGNPILINGEESITIYQPSESGGVVISERNADYPKGYHGFYIMKYEASQEQYVTFLNTLTKAQQEALLGEAFLAALSPGRYIFGDTLRPSYRNGIVLSAKPEGQPYIFDNNLNENTVYGEDGDGQCIACNYISLNDALSYACWAGLRPMSELEYERACRAPFPQEPLVGEYPWNSNSGLSRVTSITAGGRVAEIAGNTSCNVNSGSGLTGSNQGPVRCGLFARTTSTQVTAGATYWGVMEMGGNVQEIVANVANSSLQRTRNGLGSYAPGLWGTTAGQFGVRGGSFAGADSLLRVSDRSSVFSYFPSLTHRDSTVGFRLVRSLDDNIVTVNPGTISLSGSLCPGQETTVSGDAASISGISGVFPLSYVWSYSTDNGTTWTVVPNVVEKDLVYKDFEVQQTYLFKRKVICALGEASVRTLGVKVSIPTEITLQPEDTVNAPCSLSLKIESNGTPLLGNNTLSYQWMKDGVSINGATTATYAKTPTSLADKGTYTCKVKGICGEDESKTVVTYFEIEDDEMIDPRDGQTYKIRKMPDGHWWMVEDLKFGRCDAETFNTYHMRSTLDQIEVGFYGVCIASPQPNAGYLYNWQAAMQKADAYWGSNPVNSEPNNKGICPDGWHLPSGGSTGEFQQLYTALCSKVDKIYPGVGVFEGVLGGYGNGSSVADYNYSMNYWSSTYSDNVNAYYLCYYGGGLRHANYTKSLGFAVRCVKNY
ncbi:MAG: SUMF1/EgtB/PvdO family nonheme iron enzyme [Odoribacter sp.]|nr:SUMF1/EgtB/PvdO family nonheme iron enzyme [Odoribacter sp.]